MKVKNANTTLKDNGFGTIISENIVINSGSTLQVDPTVEKLIKISVQAFDDFFGGFGITNEIKFSSVSFNETGELAPTPISRYFNLLQPDKLNNIKKGEYLEFEAVFDQAAKKYIPILNFEIIAQTGVILTKYYKQ